ncbi:MAG: anti-sigma factor family protein [Pyrinomonadaceae bacterium]
MICDEIQFDLPLFSDDILSQGEAAAIRMHLPTCPLCRHKLAGLQSVRNDLRSIARPEIPNTLLNMIRERVSEAIAIPGTMPVFTQLDQPRRWREVWLMPSAIAGFATLLIGFALFSVMLSGAARPAGYPNITDAGPKTRVYLPNVTADGALTPSGYALSRSAVAGESPSVNPQGALIALTRSLVRGEMRDDEVTVVADVFGNGLAQIAEVVEPSRNIHAVAELQKALDSDPSLSPFVPADLDKRSDTVRVVFKIQSVNVSTRLAPARHSR